MNLRFSKMHGLGNDFMVIDAINQSVSLSAEKIRSLANRHFGVGFDQLLMVEPTDRKDADFRYRIYNADGHEVEQCGNGARCFATFVRSHGLTKDTAITVSTATGLLILKVQPDGQVQVDMGRPEFAPERIPFNNAVQQDRYSLLIDGQAQEFGVVSMGNPHAIQLVNDIESAPVAELGPLIESHEAFPNRVNAGFMQVVDESHIRLRVYERGAGETPACGSGACAAVAVGRLWGMLAGNVEVELSGGKLVIQWAGSDNDPVFMTGSATHVFDAELEL